MDTIYQEILKILIPSILTLITSFVGYALILMRRWIENKLHLEHSSNSFQLMDKIVEAVVNDLEQTVRPMLSDGKLSKVEQLKLKELALERSRKLIAPEIKDLLLTKITNLDEYLSSRIEYEILKNKPNKIKKDNNIRIKVDNLKNEN